MARGAWYSVSDRTSAVARTAEGVEGRTPSTLYLMDRETRNMRSGAPMSPWARILWAGRRFRRPLGLFFLAIAALGFVLPIIPGWPFIVPAVVLLGRRDPFLRYLHLLMRRILRRMRRSRIAWVRQRGQQWSAQYVRTRQALRPAIRAAERAVGHM